MRENEPASALLAIRTLGTFDVLAAGGASVFAGNARARQPLLKFLLSAEGFGASSARAAKALWPDSGEETGLGNLRVAVSHLRGALRKAAADRALISHGGRVALDPALCDIDVGRFFAAPLPPEASLAAAAEHIRAYTGTFLPGDLAVEFTAARRALVRRRFLADLETALRIAALAPSSTFAIEIESAGERAFAEEPENEGLAERLARFYVAQGRRIEALATLDRNAASGHDPAALQLLRAEILGRDVTEDRTLADAGEALIGREVEREAAFAPFAMLEHGHGGAVLIVGDPGAGTTSLATDVAGRLKRRAGAIVIEIANARAVGDVVAPVAAFFAANAAARACVVPSVAQALSAAIPSLGVPGAAAAASQPGEPRFALAFERALGQAATVAPIAIVAEIGDAHAHALELLRRLIAASPKVPLAIVLVLRTTGAALIRLELILRGGLLPVVELGPLSPYDAYELVETLRPSGDVEPALVVAQAGRNPGAIRALLDGTAAALFTAPERQPARVEIERLQAALERAEQLTERGRLATALPLLEAADEEAVLAGATGVAARIAVARARIFVLRGSERAVRALASARARAARAGLSELETARIALPASLVFLNLGLHDAAREAAAHAYAAFVQAGEVANAYAAAAIIALAETARGERANRVRSLLTERPSTLEHEVALTDVRLYAALIASTEDAREITDAARRADALLEKMLPGTAAAEATTELALALSGRRHRAAPTALRRARELVARVDAPALAARLAGATGEQSG